MKFQIWVRRPFESSGYDEFSLKTSDISGQITPVKPMEPRHKSLINGLKYSVGIIIEIGLVEPDLPSQPIFHLELW